MSSADKPTGDSDIQVVVTKALAGCGKTFDLYRTVKQSAANGNRSEKILALSFNKSLQEKAEEGLSELPRERTGGELKSLANIGLGELKSPAKVVAKTMHGIAYEILKNNGRVPQGMTGKEKKGVEIQLVHEEESARSFDNLIFAALELAVQELALVFKALGRVSDIFIDEYQDLRRDHIELLRLIIKACGTRRVYLYGDPNQKIYGYANKFAKPVPVSGLENPIRTEIADNFSSVARDFRVATAEIEERELRVCHRSTPSVQRAVNRFLMFGSAGAAGLQYEVIDEPSGADEKAKVRLFTSWREEKDWVKNEIDKLPAGSKICVIGQDSKVLRPYQSAQGFVTKNSITVATVHQMKGSEADFVFFVGVRPNSFLERSPMEDSGRYETRPKLKFNKSVRRNDSETSNVIYTGLSRARRQLFVSTAHADSPLECFRGCQDVDFEDRMVDVRKAWKRLPAIRPDANFSLKKANNSFIDTIVLMVKDEDAPFPQYVGKGVVPKKIHFGQGFVTEMGGLPMTIIHYNRRDGDGRFVFELFDLNALKRAGYNDFQIIKKCANNVINFFDSRISMEAIHVTRIDPAILRDFEDAKKAREYLNEFDRRVRESDVRSIRDHRGTEYLNPQGKPFLDWSSSSYYANYMQRSDKGPYPAVLRVYRTDAKNSSEGGKLSRSGMGLSRRNVWKIELCVRGPVVSRRYCLGRNNTVAALLNELNLDKSYLRTVFRSVLHHIGVDLPDNVL